MLHPQECTHADGPSHQKGKRYARWKVERPGWQIWEESGPQVKNLILKGTFTFPAFDDNQDWYTFIFVIDDFEGQLIDSPEGHLQWIPDSELLDLNLWTGDRIFIPWLVRPGFFSGKFVYQNKHLVEHEVEFYGG